MRGNFESLIADALLGAMRRLTESAVQTKTITKDRDVSDKSPAEIVALMAEESIPDTAWLSGSNNGYDGWTPGEILLCWEVEVPTTEDDKRRHIKSRFNNNVAWKYVHDSVTANGFKRVSFNSGRLREFSGTTAYDMFIEGDIKRLCDFYSLWFVDGQD